MGHFITEMICKRPLMFCYLFYMSLTSLLTIFMLLQIISPHTCPELPMNFWFLSPSVTHSTETPWTLPSHRISLSVLHTVSGR